MLSTIAVMFSFAFAAAPSFVQGYAIPASQISPSAWTALNQSVGGKLQNGRPLALPCYMRYTSDLNANNASNVWTMPDMSACSTIQMNKNDPVFIGDNFGGYMSYNFAPCVTTGQSCQLSALLPLDPISPLTGVCAQGGVPSYFVNATTVEDVQRSLEWAKQQNVRLVVKNTGHDYRGRSTAPDSFAVW